MSLNEANIIICIQFEIDYIYVYIAYQFIVTHIWNDLLLKC